MRHQLRRPDPSSFQVPISVNGIRRDRFSGGRNFGFHRLTVESLGKIEAGTSSDATLSSNAWRYVEPLAGILALYLSIDAWMTKQVPY
jgi:hypothetical protein